MERFAEAIECYDKVIQLNPLHADAHNNKGISFYSTEQYPESIECFEKVALIIKRFFVHLFLFYFV